ncbi:MAG: AAA family ATPase [Phycisphaerales bacterium]|nr:AAA family ATPase [Phycisphaerales bacterium]
MGPAELILDSVESVRAACQEFRGSFAALRSEVAKSMVGQKEVVELTLIALVADGHVLLEGVPGLGKTLLVRSIAQSLGLSFSRIQFTPDLMPADITGTTVIAENEGHGGRRMVFRRGPVFAQILLADEINRATPKSQSALLEAMQERTVTVGGETMALDRPFLVLATQNPIEQEGTYALPEAQLDRFLLKVAVGDVDRGELTEILNRTTGPREQTPQCVLSTDQIAKAQQLARRIIIAPHVQDYAVRLVLATHPQGEFAPEGVSRLISAGSSPRGAQALVAAAKVRALLDGRHAVSTVDVASLVPAALRHRVVRSFEAEAEGITVDALLSRILEMTPKESQL